MRFEIRLNCHARVQIEDLRPTVKLDRLTGRVTDEVPNPARRHLRPAHLPCDLARPPQTFCQKLDRPDNLQLDPKLNVCHRAVDIRDASPDPGFNPGPMNEVGSSGVQVFPHARFRRQRLRRVAHVQPSVQGEVARVIALQR